MKDWFLLQVQQMVILKLMVKVNLRLKLYIISSRGHVLGLIEIGDDGIGLVAVVREIFVCRDSQAQA